MKGEIIQLRQALKLNWGYKMEQREVILDKIRTYLEEKLSLDIADCYILTSLLAKYYLEDIEMVDMDESELEEDLKEEEMQDEVHESS